MAKVKQITLESGRAQYLFWCEGCGYEHGVSPDVHQFNGNFDKPTFSPSLVSCAHYPKRLCHSFVTDGAIAYLTDCWHALKGETRELLDVDVEIEKRTQAYLAKKESGGKETEI